MKKTFILLSVIALSACGGGTTKEKATAEAAKDTVATQPKAKENWEYAEEEDKMSGQKTYYAGTRSETRANFKFPYNQEGGSTFDLTLSKNGDGPHVLITASKGYFNTSFMDDKNVLRIRFDDGKPENFHFNGPNDNSHTDIFLKPAKKIIEKVKAAKKMFVEVTFFQEGTYVLEFNVEGLKWEHDK